VEPLTIMRGFLSAIPILKSLIGRSTFKSYGMVDWINGAPPDYRWRWFNDPSDKIPRKGNGRLATYSHEWSAIHNQNYMACLCKGKAFEWMEALKWINYLEEKQTAYMRLHQNYQAPGFFTEYSEDHPAGILRNEEWDPDNLVDDDIDDPVYGDEQQEENIIKNGVNDGIEGFLKRNGLLIGVGIGGLVLWKL